MKNMEFEDVLKKRRSVRVFRNQEVSPTLLRRVLRLANLAPSAGNLQARTVIIVKRRREKEILAQAAFNQEHVLGAPIVIVVCCLPEKSANKYGERGRTLYALQDATIFAAYLQLAAEAAGLASCWVGAFDEKMVRETLALPPTVLPVAILPVGFPAEHPAPTPRKKLDELILKALV